MGGTVFPENVDEFDIEGTLGSPYLIEIEVETSARGNEYSRIARKNGVRKAGKRDLKEIKKPKRPPFAWQIAKQWYREALTDSNSMKSPRSDTPLLNVNVAPVAGTVPVTSF